MEDSQFHELCAHYKDSFDVHLGTVKARDRHFYFLLVLLALFALQLGNDNAFRDLLTGFSKSQLGIEIGPQSQFLETSLWFLMFGFSTRYFQLVVLIEKQYAYLHEIEKLLNSRYVGTVAFTREGSFYLRSYPIFSNWAAVLYTVAFPSIIVGTVTTGVLRFLNSLEVHSQQALPILLIYILIGTSSVLYFVHIHGKALIRVLKIFVAFGKRTLSRRRKF